MANVCKQDLNTLTGSDRERTITASKVVNGTLKNHQPTRRIAREIVLRAMYALEMRQCEIEQVLDDPLVSEDAPLPSYSVRLLNNIERYREQLDDLIREKVEKWEFHRIALVDRLILRMAIAELFYFPDVPPKVTINEAIEIAKKFSTAKSGRFVNGILDAVYNDITSGKIILKGNDSGKT